jgi:uncharacterized membrane protein (UPF0127 family)
MKRTIWILIISLVILLVLSLSQSWIGKKYVPSPTATIKNHTFNLIVARNSKDKEIGLSKYQSIPQDKGMLFMFDTPSYYSFWMKNMKFPIDIIYIDKNHIVTIYSNVQPPQTEQVNLSIFQPTQPADTVLEINSGLSEKYNFKKGDLVNLKL